MLNKPIKWALILPMSEVVVTTYNTDKIILKNRG